MNSTRHASDVRFREVQPAVLKGMHKGQSGPYEALLRGGVVVDDRGVRPMLSAVHVISPRSSRRTRPYGRPSHGSLLQHGRRTVGDVRQQLEASVSDPGRASPKDSRGKEGVDGADGKGVPGQMARTCTRAAYEVFASRCALTRHRLLRVLRMPFRRGK